MRVCPLFHLRRQHHLGRLLQPHQAGQALRAACIDEIAHKVFTHEQVKVNKWECACGGGGGGRGPGMRWWPSEKRAAVASAALHTLPARRGQALRAACVDESMKQRLKHGIISLVK